MKRRGKAVQLAMHCRCGRESVLALGMCSTCYTLRRQDVDYFGGLREAVLERDGYRCRVCDAPGTGKRSIIVQSPRARKIGTQAHDLALPGLPCEGASHQSCLERNAAAPSAALERTAPEGA